jgi:uncharacterized tannase-like protein DUF6351
MGNGAPGSNRFGHAVAATIGLTAVVVAAGSREGHTQSRGALQIHILSSRPDMVSGGDALVEVVAPSGMAPGDMTLMLNGKDVSSRLKPEGAPGHFRGLVEGMGLGANMLQATLKSSSARAMLSVTNYPISGPILSGPHLKPYQCDTEPSGLGPALDADCSAARKVWYVYRASNDTFKTLDNPIGSRPADLVTTTTNEGKTVPYIVRVEGGVINRAVYQAAILDDPTAATVEASAWKPGAGWNRKIVVSFGGGSGTQYVQGVVPLPSASVNGGAVNHLALSRGFAYVVSSELVNGRRGNAVLQGETLMMIKEYLIERYGVPRWVTGSGGSGGAIQQLVITQLYPGLLDGLMPSLTFPDSTLHTIDSILLTNLWPKLDPAVWTQEKKSAVEGFTPGTAAAWNAAYGRLGVPTNAQGCALADKRLVYDPVNNPGGARCTTQDIRINIYGRDPKTGWARRPTDNVGIQYGLAALNSGAISVDEFLEVNARIGGTDIEGKIVPDRASGDPIALRAAYESGLQASYNSALANVPILMSRSYNDARGDIHDRQRDFVVRARLQKANGRVDNTVVWIASNASATTATLDTMNKWLDGIIGDPAPLSPDKVVKHKPAEAVDTCWDPEGNRIVEPASFDAKNRCNALYPVHSEPRLVAGAPLTNDVMKCQLKPVNFSEYRVPFTEAQKAKMTAVFPTGVCDYTKPGVGQVPVKGTYQRYGAAVVTSSSQNRYSRPMSQR